MAQPVIPAQSAWTDYLVQASAFRDSKVSPQGGVMIAGRVVDATHFYDLEMRSDIAGSGREFWYIAKRNGSIWTQIAGGPMTTQPIPYYTLRLAFAGNTISAFMASNYSTTFVALGSGTDASYARGGVGLGSFNTANARFDAVRVTMNKTTPAPLSTASAASNGAGSVPGRV